METQNQISELMEAAVNAQSVAEMRETFGKLCEILPWKASENIPWRDDASAIHATLDALRTVDQAPLWRTHRAANPFEGVGEDWSHGSLLAFPPTMGDAGLGYGAGTLPEGINFVTSFKDLMGVERPFGGDFSMEWLAHDNGDMQHRIAAFKEVQPFAAVLEKIRSTELKTHEAVHALYETPLSEATASVEQRFMSRYKASEGYQVVEIPDTPEWKQLLARVADFDRELRPNPRKIAFMPPAASHGLKCSAAENIFAKLEAAGIGTPLSAINAKDRPEKLLAAAGKNRQLNISEKVEYLLDIAASGVTVLDDAKLHVAPRDQAEVWETVLESLSRARAEVLLDRMTEWKGAYSPEVVSAISQGLQACILGENLTWAQNEIRGAANSRAQAMEFATKGQFEIMPINIASGRYVGPVISETNLHVVQDVGRRTCVIHLKSQLGVDRANGMLKAQYKDGHGSLDAEKSHARSNDMSRVR